MGAIITLISFSLIAILTLGEFVQYRKIHTESTLVVDKSRGEQLTISLNMTFPRVPCYCESVAYNGHSFFAPFEADTSL